MDSKDAERMKRKAEFKRKVATLPIPEARPQVWKENIAGNTIQFEVRPNNNHPQLRNEAGYIDTKINGEDIGRTWWDTHGNGVANQYKTIEKAWEAIRKRLQGLDYLIK